MISIDYHLLHNSNRLAAPIQKRIMGRGLLESLQHVARLAVLANLIVILAVGIRITLVGNRSRSSVHGR